MFLGNVSLVDRLQPEVIKFLQQDGTKQLLNDVLQKEWEKWKEREVKELESFVSKEAVIQTMISTIKVEETVGAFLNQSVRKACEPVREEIVQNMIPKLVQKGLKWGISNVGNVLRALTFSGDCATRSIYIFNRTIRRSCVIDYEE